MGLVYAIAGVLALTVQSASTPAAGNEVVSLVGERDRATEMVRAQLDDYGFPFEFVAVHSSEAVAERDRLSAVDGQIAIIVGDDEELLQLASFFADTAELDPDGLDPAEIVARASSIDLDAELLNRADFISDDQVRQIAATLEAIPSPSQDEIITEPVALYDILDFSPLERVNIVVLPTNVATDAPAYLRFGNWNYNPNPETHIAMLRRWSENYGAEVVVVSSDTIELKVSNRPETYEDAVRLAVAQYLYCPDIVEQGVGSLEALAVVLMHSDWWFFWWD